ncbi:serine hydrolase domain-containing protein [Aquimarina hainanensis]|uniref:Serine hydrolase domain-containing protein n=1 Tax=Aquimarina hainanensis TaxID=1578017 RepID=A0ABW5NDY7_9FLAO
MKLFLRLLPVLLFLISCEKDDASPNSTKLLDDKLEKLYKESLLAGFSVAITDDSSVLYKNAFGYADIEQQKKYDDRTIHNIGSISKTYIAIAIMKAVEQQKLQLDADINTYLPFDITHPYHPEKPITIRHLATHTSGISDDITYYKSYVFEHPEQVDPSYYPQEYHPLISTIKGNKKIDDAIFFQNALSSSGNWYTKETFLSNAPGSKYEYSNIGAALAAYVIEQATGMSYEDYTKKHIFSPLQMNDTGWSFNQIDMNLHATLYYEKELKTPMYSLITKADGGVLTNTTDFTKYMIEIINAYHGKGTLLSEQSYREIFTHQATLAPIKETKGGLFWELPNTKIYHDGGDPGIMTICLIDPIKNRGYYFMTNMSDDFNPEVVISIRKIWNVLKNNTSY